jgi:hypothetical protein
MAGGDGHFYGGVKSMAKVARKLFYANLNLAVPVIQLKKGKLCAKTYRW